MTEDVEKLKAIASKAIREQIPMREEIEALRAENARLRDLLDNALGWLGWYDHIEEHMPLLSVDSIRTARTEMGESDE